VGEGTTDTPQGVGHGGGREASHHVPVLLQEAIEFLNVRRGGTYIDATVGLGGHSYEIAKRLGAQGHLIGLDKDPAALEKAGFGLRASGSGSEDWPTIELRNASFASLADDRRLRADGILADIGVSSLQLSDAARGFSFQADGPLDMRMDPQSERTAEQVVNHLDERELADVIYEFGEERRSRRIARAIVRSRPIRSTAHLAEVISAAARPMNSEQRRIHPATRTFQALRIFVNRELDQFSLAGGSHCEGCLPRRREAGLLQVADQEASDGIGSGKRSQSAGAQREVAGGGEDLTAASGLRLPDAESR
jgi:16S rRNA (cytosine1402-N4)-methyltransferase